MPQRCQFLTGLAATAGAVMTGCATTRNPATLRGYSVPAIDLHAHWHAPEFGALIEKEGGLNGAKAIKNTRGEVVFGWPGMGALFQQQYMSLEARLKAMDTTGVDIHDYLRNFIGNPTDTGVAAAALVFGGVMDAFPKLDVVLPHAGGITPVLIGRWDHGSGVRPETKHMTKAPSTYLRRFHYNAVSHNAQIMRNIVRQVGADRVVLGSDHPADMSVERPVDFVESIPELSRSERELIFGGNAKRLLKVA